METSKRWHLLDTIRGITLINMVFFHFCYDIFVIYGLIPRWDRLLPVRIWQQAICQSFLLISGIVFHFSRSHLKRGLLINAWGFIITIVTLIVLPREVVWFGILNCTGSVILLAWLFERLLAKINHATGLFCSLFLFLFTRHISSGYLGFGSFELIRLPKWLYQFFPAAWLGFPPAGFHSSDYFPILPWLFLFLTGYYLYYFLQKSHPERWLVKGRIPFISLIGRKTLWIYVLHQPVLMLICYLIFGH